MLTQQQKSALLACVQRPGAYAGRGVTGVYTDPMGTEMSVRTGFVCPLRAVEGLIEKRLLRRELCDPAGITYRVYPTDHGVEAAEALVRRHDAVIEAALHGHAYDSVA
jgi:hypothetical protein